MRKYFRLCHDEKPETECQFKVLNVRNQGNNFDCGLVCCLLAWQFYETMEVRDLEMGRFPWRRELSHQYRFAIAYALAL